MVYGDGLENRCCASNRGFESHPLRRLLKLKYPQLINNHWGYFYLASRWNLFMIISVILRNRSRGANPPRSCLLRVAYRSQVNRPP